MKRYELAQIIALVATVFSVIGWAIVYFKGNDWGYNFVGIGVMCGLVSYVFGGLLNAIKSTIGIAKWGLFVGPFPYNICFVVISGTLALMFFLCCPIFPVRKAYKDSIV